MSVAEQARLIFVLTGEEVVATEVELQSCTQLDATVRIVFTTIKVGMYKSDAISYNRIDFEILCNINQIVHIQS